MRFLFLGIFYFLANQLSAFDLGKILDKYPPETIQKCNTAQQVNSMSDIEKEFVLLTNLARVNPPLFGRLFLEEYLKAYKISASNPYVVSLRNDLNKKTSLPILNVLVPLNKPAAEHVAYCIRTNRCSHDGFEKRMKIAQKLNQGYFAENCAMGQESAIQLLMDLLIDDGIRNVGHRKSILNPNFKNTGLSIKNWDGGYVLVHLLSGDFPK